MHINIKNALTMDNEVCLFYFIKTILVVIQ